MKYILESDFSYIGLGVPSGLSRMFLFLRIDLKIF